MSVTSTYDHPVTGDPSIISGSHWAIRMESGAVIVRDVELFSTMETGRMGKVTTETLAEIAANTNRAIERGQHPQIIISHSDDEHPSIGRIAGPVRVSRCATTGLDTIYGDLEFNPGEFGYTVGDNRYPRRSVEIIGKAIVNLSLLGRSSTGAVLPDTKFSASDDAVCVESPASITFQRHPNGDEPMATPSMTDIINALKGATPEERAEFASALSAECPTEPAATVEPDAPVTAPANTVEVDRAEFSALNNRVAQQASQLDQLRAEVARRDVDARFRPILNEMRNYGGFTTINVDAEMERMHAFSSDAERDALIEHIRTNYKQDITGPALATVAMPRPGSTAPPRNDFSAEEVARITAITSREGVSYGIAAHRVNTEVASRIGIANA